MSQAGNLNEKLEYEISERKRAEEELEKRNELLSTLLDVSNLVSSTLELKPLLEAILDRLKTIIEYKGAKVFIVSGKHMKLFAHRSSLSAEEEKDYFISIDSTPVGIQLVRKRMPLVISDIYGDDPMAVALRSALGKYLDTFFRDVRSWMGLPMIIKDRVIGVLTLDHGKEGYYDSYHVGLGTAFANQAAIEFENASLYNENARMYQEEHRRHLEDEQRRHVAESLRDILAILNTNRPLDELLDFIIREATRLMGAASGILCRLRKDDGGLEAEAGWGMEDVLAGGAGRLHAEAGPLPVEARSLTSEAHPLPDEAHSLPGVEALRKAVLGRMPVAVSDVVSGLNSDMLALPLICKDEVYGGIALYFAKSGTLSGDSRSFAKDELDLAMAFAGQAALAIDNSRLRTQAEEMAVAAERNRIARDLHDAVTQTLFSASLIADVLPRIWERNPEDGRARLEELRQLTRGALAEMRTLLLELRPATLAEAQLPDLLRRLTEAASGRGRLPVTLETGGNTELPIEVKIAFYRIAQEALNNITKHSDASMAVVSLKGKAEDSGQAGGEGSGQRSAAGGRAVELRISDDGRGFDPESVTAEHFGVGIMRERAEAAGASLTVDARPGKGTDIILKWESGSQGEEDADGRK